MNRSRCGQRGILESYFKKSSYKTRKISTSEKAEPTWPRPPFSNMRTIRRRSSRERASSEVVLTGGGLIMAGKAFVFRANPVQHLAGLVQLLPLKGGTVRRRRGGKMPPQKRPGQEFIQDDHAPLQS